MHMQNKAEQTRKIVSELTGITVVAGCVGWLTGSQQALYTLYNGRSHPEYFGTPYNELNNKKFWALSLVGWHDV